jgi:hypothetical protein
MATFHCLSSIFKFVTGLGDIYHIAQSKVIYPCNLLNIYHLNVKKKKKNLDETGLPVFLLRFLLLETDAFVMSFALYSVYVVPMRNKIKMCILDNQRDATYIIFFITGVLISP